MIIGEVSCLLAGAEQYVARYRYVPVTYSNEDNEYCTVLDCRTHCQYFSGMG